MNRQSHKQSRAEFQGWFHHKAAAVKTIDGGGAGPTGGHGISMQGLGKGRAAKPDWNAFFQKKVSKGTLSSADAGGADEPKQEESMVSAGENLSGEQNLSQSNKKKKRKAQGHAPHNGVSAPGLAVSAGGVAADVRQPEGYGGTVLGDGKFPYQVDPSDHAETPAEAYADVAPMLEQLALALGKTKATVRIYDPYYCDGRVVSLLGALGFPLVYNRREDFYDKVARAQTPDFDILLTNPPYSGDHPARILDFCCASGKPWLLLVPNWVYTKDYYPWCMRTAAAPQGYTGGATAGPSVAKGQGASTRPRFDAFPEPLYLVPAERYTYWTPSWLQASKTHVSTSPFPSFWFVQCGAHRQRICAWFAGLKPRLRAHLTLAHGISELPNEVRAAFDVYKKRKNPRARKADRVKRAAAHEENLDKRNRLRESREHLAKSTR